MKLQNKIAVITGAGKGIGRAIAELFLKEGAHLILNSRTKADLDSFKREHNNSSDRITIINGDISKEPVIKKLISETIKKHKRIDILINNAGFGIFNELVKSTNKEFDDMFNTNVRALYILTRGFLPYMIKQKEGTIINIASISGKQGFATGSIYCASKHAVMGLSRALFLEVRKHNIRVTAICPGSVDTDFFNKESHTSSSLKRKSMLTSKDIAESCLYAAVLPVNAAVSEIEIRPTNPQY
jgi:3-oxoacyl-[acyl-carrier protein] reductase